MCIDRFHKQTKRRRSSEGNLEPKKLFVVKVKGFGCWNRLTAMEDSSLLLLYYPPSFVFISLLLVYLHNNIKHERSFHIDIINISICFFGGCGGWCEVTDGWWDVLVLNSQSSVSTTTVFFVYSYYGRVWRVLVLLDKSKHSSGLLLGDILQKKKKEAFHKIEIFC